MDREVVDLYLDDLIPNRFQPREVFDEKALEELAISIKEHGVIQPIIVRKIGDKYEIIAGERRYKASVLAGLTKIPAIIRNLDDKETSKVALLENLQRKDLTAIEEARTYQKILELDAMTQEELGKTMGKSQPSIANKLRLLELPDEIQDSLLHNQISERHARSLLSLKTTDEQIAMLNKIITNRMTVREVDEEIKQITGVSNVESSEEQYQENSNNLVEEIKNKSTDIITPVEKTANINDLLRFNPPMVEETKPEEVNQFKYVGHKEELITPKIEEKETSGYDANLINLQTPIFGNNVNVLSELEEETIDQPIQTSSSLKEVINSFRDCSSKAKANGFNISIDEMDLENKYQIVIKIDKNN
ncbi:MAG: ParB/RepB/Spo0J family partition protein [Bacilli bacterium]|nr:ParB/RepB/Spo0J family partition protein [Bacilli bacterium]